MKSLLKIIIIILMCSSLSAFAQSTVKYNAGFIGGMNISDLYFENNQGANDQDISSLTLFGAGAVFDIKLSDNSSLLFEPMYLQKGGKIEEGSDPMNQPPGEIISAYFELPVLLKLTYGEEFKPYILLGPSFGYLLSSDLEMKLAGYNFTGDFSTVMEDFDLGLVIGLGLQYPVDFGNLFIEAKYSYGLLNQMKGGTVTIKDQGIEIDLDVDKEADEFINRGFQIMVGMTFPL